MNEVTQPIFTRPFSEQLREELSSGNTVVSYLQPQMNIPEGGILQSTLLVPEEIPELNPDVADDLDNAIKIYEFLDKLDKTQASDKRLWIYLSHVTFRPYTMGRWGLKISKEELANNAETRNKAVNYVGERWFLSGNARSLRRHSIARLWWSAHLTVAPWEKDPEYFGNLQNEDRFVYTRVLFQTQDIVQQILERRLGWSDRLLIAILEFLRQHPEIAQSRKAVRGVMKELNLVLGYRKLTVLSFDELLAVISDTAKDINASE